MGTILTNQARTNLGPLTRAFKPPPSCSLVVEGCQNCNFGWQAQTCFSSADDGIINYGVEDFTNCWPPRTNGAPTPGPPFSGWGFYSPGVVCPSGYVTACSATGGGVSDWPIQYGLLEKETAVGCCPSGYSCTNGNAQTCVSLVTSTNFPIATCQSGTSGGTSLFIVPTTVSEGTISTYSLFAPLIQLNWQASDRQDAAAISTSSSPSSFSGSSSSASSSSSSNSSNSPSNFASTSSISTSTPAASSTFPTTSAGTISPSPLGISTGAKAIIGVGVTAATIAIAFLVFFIVWKRKSARKTTGRDSLTTIEPLHKFGAARNGRYVMHELGAAKGMYSETELGAGNGPYATAELPLNPQRVELHTGQEVFYGPRPVAELR